MIKNQYLETDEIEINLSELFHMLFKKWWLMLIAALLGFIISVGITKFAIRPTYQSQAMIYILTKTTSVTSMVDLQIGAAITGDFELISTSKPVIDAAIREIDSTYDISFTRKDILEMLTIANEEDTRILKIQAVHENPEYACFVANAVADATSRRMAEIMKSDPPTMVERAEIEEEPISPSIVQNAAIGIIIGLLIVSAVLILRFITNDNIKTEEDVEKYLGEVTLASIPRIKSKKDMKENDWKKS